MLAEKRDRLQDRARKLSAQANLVKQQREEYNLSAREAKTKREEWNDRVAQMRARGGLGDIGEAKAQSQSYHQKVVKFSADAQMAHEKMRQLWDEADKLRGEAQVAHEQCITCRKAADAEHEKYIAAIRKHREGQGQPPGPIRRPGHSTSIWRDAITSSAFSPRPRS